MGFNIVAILLVLAGAIGIGLLYSYRPIEGLDSAIAAIAHGRDTIDPSVYYTGMALAAAAVVIGLFTMLRRG